MESYTVARQEELIQKVIAETKASLAKIEADPAGYLAANYVSDEQKFWEAEVVRMTASGWQQPRSYFNDENEVSTALTFSYVSRVRTANVSNWRPSFVASVLFASTKLFASRGFIYLGALRSF